MEIVLKTMKWEKSQGELLCGYLRESHCHYFAVRAVMTEQARDGENLGFYLPTNCG